jgi:hypothetical protein
VNVTIVEFVEGALQLAKQGGVAAAELLFDVGEYFRKISDWSQMSLRFASVEYRLGYRFDLHGNGTHCLFCNHGTFRRIYKFTQIITICNHKFAQSLQITNLSIENIGCSFNHCLLSFPAFATPSFFGSVWLLVPPLDSPLPLP